MLDPTNITKYNQTIPELEESILFWVCAAGKNGKTAARCLEKFLSVITFNNTSPFESIRLKNLQDNAPEWFNDDDYKSMIDLMKWAGIGCYTHKARTFVELVYSKLDLRTCTTEELESIYGIGMKTSRCFIIHSRPNASCAGLDIHVLKFMKEMGYDVPKTTPTGKKYLQLEKEFVKIADKYNKTVAELDLEIWNHYSKTKLKGVNYGR